MRPANPSLRSAARRGQPPVAPALWLLLGIAGCAGTRIYDLSADSGADPWTEHQDNLLNAPVTATLLNGRMLDGRFEREPGDTLLFRHEALDSVVLIGQSRIHTAELPGCTWCVVAGSVAGLTLTGAGVLAAQDAEDIPPAYAALVVVAGAVVGGTVAGIAGSAKRYLFNALPEGRDTLWVGKSQIISLTNTRIRILQEGGPVSYSREVVHIIGRGSYTGLVRPSGGSTP